MSQGIYIGTYLDDPERTIPLRAEILVAGVLYIHIVILKDITKYDVFDIDDIKVGEWRSTF